MSSLLLRAQPDARLVALLREGHESAFEEIVRRYRAPLVRFAATIVPPHLAEDTVQEALIRAHAAILANRSEIALRGWLHTIVHNGAVSARRRVRPTEQLDESIDGVPQPPEAFERRERMRGVVAQLKELPAPQREALVRTELAGSSAHEIAASLGTTPGAVHQLVFRARAAMRGGAALVLPYPLLRALLSVRGDGAEAAAGGAAAGSLGGGAATAIKLGAAAMVAAVAIGPGGSPVDREPDPQVRIEEERPQGSPADEATPTAIRAARYEPARSAEPDASTASGGPAGDGTDAAPGPTGSRGDADGGQVSASQAAPAPAGGHSDPPPTGGHAPPPGDGDATHMHDPGGGMPPPGGGFTQDGMAPTREHHAWGDGSQGGFGGGAETQPPTQPAP